tara:strand:+ start:534 stop:968 length:435 start_codon:yes stop_codon:yes gene_type:complete
MTPENDTDLDYALTLLSGKQGKLRQYLLDELRVEDGTCDTEWWRRTQRHYFSVSAAVDILSGWSGSTADSNTRCCREGRHVITVCDTTTSTGSSGLQCAATVRYTAASRAALRSPEHQAAYDAAVALGGTFSLRGLEVNVKRAE